jgi:hypothetical protein
MHSGCANVETDPTQPQPSTSATATGPALREDKTEDGWKKVERKREGKGKEKRGAGNGKEVSVPSWADKARGGGVYVTVFIGGTRDARLQMARKPKKEGKRCARAPQWEEERARRPITVFTVLRLCLGRPRQQAGLAGEEGPYIVTACRRFHANMTVVDGIRSKYIATMI